MSVLRVLTTKIEDQIFKAQQFNERRWVMPLLCIEPSAVAVLELADLSAGFEDKLAPAPDRLPSVAVKP